MKTGVFSAVLVVTAGALAPAGCSSGGDHRLGAIVAATDAAVTPQDTGGACKTAPTAADRAPLDMYLMVEKSLSNHPAGSTGWDALASGIGSFVTSNDVAGVGIGIQYFPLVGGSASAQCVARCGPGCDCLLRCGCGWCDCAGNGCQCASRWFASCELGDYAKPAVEIAPLPAASNDLVAWLFSQNREEGPATTRPALQGAIGHAHDWAMANSGRNAIVVLIVNGMPSEDVCPPNQAADMAQVAAAGAQGSPTVSTFVIASGSDLAAAVDPIAAAGGSGHAWNIGTDLAKSTRLSTVLAQIRDSAMACQYAVPKGDVGSPDYATVGVEVRLGPNASPIRLPHVQDSDACRPGTGGWYYDDPNRPSRIVLCDSTCGAVQESPGAVVSTLLGCPEQARPPR
jgi:hypothetical protein